MSTYDISVANRLLARQHRLTIDSCLFHFPKFESWLDPGKKIKEEVVRSRTGSFISSPGHLYKWTSHTPNSCCIQWSEMPRARREAGSCTDQWHHQRTRSGRHFHIPHNLISSWSGGRCSGTIGYTRSLPRIFLFYTAEERLIDS